MKKTLSVLALGVLPALSLAAGNHAGGHGPAHGMPGHDMSTISSAPLPTGTPGGPAKVTRTIELTMDDTMRFTPSEIHVSAGDTVRFFIKDKGKIPHEMVIGSIANLKALAAEMQKIPGMQHAEPNMITLAPSRCNAGGYGQERSGTRADGASGLCERHAGVLRRP